MPKIRSEFVDYDYLDKLNKEELDWLNRFTGEYHGASFTRTDDDIQTYEKYGKDSNDRNNRANRDLYGNLKNKANKKLVNYDTLGAEVDNLNSKDTNPRYIEDTYIDFLENKEIEEMLQEYDEAMKNFIAYE